MEADEGRAEAVAGREDRVGRTGKEERHGRRGGGEATVAGDGVVAGHLVVKRGKSAGWKAAGAVWKADWSDAARCDSYWTM